MRSLAPNISRPRFLKTFASGSQIRLLTSDNVAQTLRSIPPDSQLWPLAPDISAQMLTIHVRVAALTNIWLPESIGEGSSFLFSFCFRCLTTPPYLRLGFLFVRAWSLAVCLWDGLPSDDALHATLGTALLPGFLSPSKLSG